MPIYEYRCESCGHSLEVLQRVDVDPLIRCPNCAEDRLRKQLTAAGFRLKGGGWYETDFKGGRPSKDGERPEGKAKADAKADAKGKDGASKSSSKTDKTSEAKVAQTSAATKN